MNETLFEILQVVIIALCGVVTRYLIPWLRLKIETEKGIQILEFIKAAVSGAEQIMSGHGLGAEKKTYVINMTKQFLSDKKLI